MSLVCRQVRRGSKRRKVLFVFLWISVTVFGFTLLKSEQHSFPLRPTSSQDSDVSPTVTVERHQNRPSLCRPSSLPPSIQLHCRMYRERIITGSLCAPLCDDGQICSAGNTFGHAHREVIVTQCQNFCDAGRDVKAVLKHDETSVCTDGYQKHYSAVNHSTMENGSLWTDSLQKLVQSHLPVQDVPTLLGRLLEDTAVGDTDFSNRTISISMYNTLKLLFRQKEYVLFQAYKNKGIFPRVYGVCGPLYLVEYCNPLLDSKDPVMRDVQPVILPRNPALKVDLSDKKTPLNLDSLFMGKRPRSAKQEIQLPEKHFPMQESHKLNSGKNAVQAAFMWEDEDKIRIGSEDQNVYGQKSDSQQTTRPFPAWSERVRSAIRILRFLEHLEHKDTFLEHIHLCDPKLEHFAVGDDDGKVKLIDADLVLFDVNRDMEMNSRGADIGVCTSDEDCSDVMCRRFCRKETGRCEKRLVNNNLQGICENVFLRPSFQHGILFANIPPSVHDNVTKALCECAARVTLQDGLSMRIPSAAVRAKLVDVLEKSVVPRVTEADIGSKGIPLLFESC